MFNTSKAYEMNFMFDGLYQIKSIDLSHFDTRNLVMIQGMFDYLYNLEYLVYHLGKLIKLKVVLSFLDIIIQNICPKMLQ